MDYIRPTPRNPIYGLLADQLEKLYSPTQTQQMQGLMRLLMVPEVSKTMNLLAYGEPLTTGAGGIGGTTRVKPEVLDAAMAVAPMAPVAGRAARGTARMVGQEMADRVTTGRSMLPSLLAETPSTMFIVPPSIIREGNPIQSAVVLVGDRIFTGRTHGDALNRAIYEGVVRKEGGKYIFPKGVEVNSDLFMTKDGQIIDRFQASKMFDIGASETAIEKGLMQNKPSNSMSVDSYMEQAKAIKQQKEKPSFTYSQQAALDTAQKNAALPISEGGLGLPPTNTPMDRAMAMGFDVENPQYHATDVDFRSINPSSRGKMGAGVYTSPDVQYAEKYSALENRRVLPMMSKGYYADANKRTDIFDKVREDAFANNPNLTSRELHDLVAQEMQSRGYSGFDVDKERLTFNPSDLRSTFAAFDPMRRNESDILAGLLPASLLADPETRRKLDEELSLLYTK
jgi:hypothetical protein